MHSLFGHKEGAIVTFDRTAPCRNQSEANVGLDRRRYGVVGFRASRGRLAGSDECAS